MLLLNADTENGWGVAARERAEPEASTPAYVEQGAAAPEEQPPAGAPAAYAQQRAAAAAPSSSSSPPAFLEFPAREPEPASQQSVRFQPSPLALPLALDPSVQGVAPVLEKTKSLVQEYLIQESTRGSMLRSSMCSVVDHL